MEVEAEVRRHVAVRLLLVRQHDVEPDGHAARLRRTAIAGLHDAGAATRHDHVLPVAGGDRSLRHDPREPPRLVVVAGQGGQRLRLRPIPVRGIGNARAAEEDDGGLDPVLRHHQLWLHQFELQPHGPEFVPHHEVGVGESEAIGRRPALRTVRRLPYGFDVFLRVAQRLLPVVVHFLSSGVDCTRGFPALYPAL